MNWTLSKQLLLPLVVIFAVVTVAGTFVGLRLARHNADVMVGDQLKSTSVAMELLLTQQGRDLMGLASSLANTSEVHTAASGGDISPLYGYFDPVTTIGNVDSLQLIAADGTSLAGVGPLPVLEAAEMKKAQETKAFSTITAFGDSLWLIGLAPVEAADAPTTSLVLTGKLIDQEFLDSLAAEIGAGIALTVDGLSIQSMGTGTLPRANGPTPSGEPVIGDHYGTLTSELATGLPGSTYVTVSVPTDEIMGRVRNAAFSLIGLVWFGGIMLSLAVVLVARSVTRPIHSLVLKAQDISRGAYGQTMRVEGVEEIRALKHSFNQMSLALHESYQELSQLANTDALTGLCNHRYLQERLTKGIELSRISDEPLAVTLIDIDNFKLFNSTYGHAAGDKVLRLIADQLVSMLKGKMLVGRYGGDKFMIIAPGSNRRKAGLVAGRIRRRLIEQGVYLDGGQRLPLRVSMGIAVCPQDSTNKEELLAYVDASLFESKRAGGDAITLANRNPDELCTYQNTTLGVLDGLVQAVDRKDRYTKSHSEENAEYAMMLGKTLGLSENTQSALRIAGLLHDVGKIGIPDHILKKPGPLTPVEREIVRHHVILSDLIIKGVPHAGDVSDAVVNHHERWDGTGYPRGLKGEEIPLLGRIMALVDAYSAITSDRPFRKAQTHEYAVEELRAHTGAQFDPNLVDIFIDLMDSQQAESTAA
jgi:diguanylate cyclase (GGDEF)-like protein